MDDSSEIGERQQKKRIPATLDTLCFYIKDVIQPHVYPNSSFLIALPEPMKKIYPRVELTANFLIIIVALLFAVVLVQREILNKPAFNQASRVQPTFGSRVNLSDVNWSQHPKTLILALKTRCHFCSESAPFYKRLIEGAQNENVKLVAVFPTSKEEGANHLNELGLTNLDVKQAPLNSLQVSETPTLILTNARGEITNYWVGRLTPDKETEMISHLR